MPACPEITSSTALMFNYWCHECNVDKPPVYFKRMFNIEGVVHNTWQVTEYKNQSFFPALEAKMYSTIRKSLTKSRNKNSNLLQVSLILAAFLLEPNTELISMLLDE